MLFYELDRQIKYQMVLSKFSTEQYILAFLENHLL